MTADETVSCDAAKLACKIALANISELGEAPFPRHGRLLLSFPESRVDTTEVGSRDEYTECGP